MSHAEDILKLRKRVLDAVNAGIVDNNLKDFYEATLLQILNESERQRQTCVKQAEAFRKQASVADGQAAAYSAMGSIVYSVLNGYIVQEERAKREEAARALEQASKEEYAEALRQKQEQIDREEAMLEPEPEEEQETESDTSNTSISKTSRVRKSRRGRKSSE